ncbi:MAG: HAMP domain-containing protein [Candidatus Scalindua sp.]|nr:HAMP domain-containing protein [Candidatus Scalindua sp.]MBT5307465.1 HAMP domain-containing protein [Candidatus Scalindua sp.]
MTKLQITVRVWAIVIGARDGDNIKFLNSLKYLTEDAIFFKIPLKGDVAVPMKSALQGRDGTIIGQDYRNIAVIAAYQPIGWRLVTKMDKSETFEPLKPLSTIAFTLGGISSIMAIAVCIFVSVSSSRSIKELTDATQKLANEDLGHRIKINRNDEIGTHANSFNDMA